jgi:phage tail sheath protein FI
MMAMFAKSDQTRKEGVAASPSNMLVRGVVELVNPVEISLIDRNTQANLLNSNGIGIIANIDGFRTWGNRSTTDDTAFTFINVIRTSDHVKDIIASSHLDLIDRNITLNYELILLQRINGILKNLIANDTLLVGRAYRNPTLNTPESLQSGKFYVDYAIGIPGIAEELIFTAHIVNGYVANIEEIN